MFDRYNIVSDDDLRIATQKVTMYVDPHTQPSASACEGDAVHGHVTAGSKLMTRDSYFV